MRHRTTLGVAIKVASQKGQRLPTTLDMLLARRLRTERERRGLRQDDVAALARRWGFNWTQATVATIEAGRRLSKEEMLLLPWIAAGQSPETIEEGCDAPIELHDLIDRASLVT